MILPQQETLAGARTPCGAHTTARLARLQNRLLLLVQHFRFHRPKPSGMERRDYGNYLRCVVPDCFQAKEVEISFHLFPDRKTDARRYRKWLHALKLKHAPSNTAKGNHALNGRRRGKIGSDSKKSVTNKKESNTKKMLSIACPGISNFKMLEVFEKAVKMIPDATFLERWDISVRHLILLVCIKLKTDMSFRCISSLFDVTPKTASKYFRGFVPLLADVMRVAVPWQDGDLLKKDLPYHFRQFQNVRAVLDCTETVKFLVSVTPGGVFNYVSQGFVGKASDKFIFNASGMITMFDEGDSIMVDKGFAISNELSQHRLEMIRPPLLQGAAEHRRSEAKCINRTSPSACRACHTAVEKLQHFH
ncbi:conserved hypothetical protein [Culex quinquefasciatus]|uniref:DDE Tnp4 domain-containing protein n=1 Tax=Culex quinquefasciatus TaxID=7176 RepID=B0X9D1_CULQU|nr:conserved hypothetical protein [Culex quinquefasciatus]|eukprot:XP_001866253.1 conserved hypothetical protein [Culex quinquefasciatus]